MRPSVPPATVQESLRPSLPPSFPSLRPAFLQAQFIPLCREPWVTLSLIQRMATACDEHGISCSIPLILPTGVRKPRDPFPFTVERDTRILIATMSHTLTPHQGLLDAASNRPLLIITPHTRVKKHPFGDAIMVWHSDIDPDATVDTLSEHIKTLSHRLRSSSSS